MRFLANENGTEFYLDDASFKRGGAVVIWGSDDVVHISHELSVLDFEELAKFIEDNIEFKEKP